MNERLHPLTLGEILDRTAHLYRSRFLVFVGIALVPSATAFLFIVSLIASVASIGVIAKNAVSTTHSMVAAGVFIALLLLFVPAALAVNALGEAALTDASARLFLGAPITMRAAYKTAWQSKWRFLGLYVLQGLIILGIPGVVLFIAVMLLSIGTVAGGSPGQQGLLFGGVMLLLIVGLGTLAVWLLLRFCLAFPACVVEQAPATAALQRASRLSQGTRGRIFVLYLLGVVLNQVLAMGITIPALIIMALVPALRGPARQNTVGLIAMFFTYGAFFVVKALVKPIYGIALTLFYFDQRIRKEAFDIEWMMQEAGMLIRPPSYVADAPEAPAPVVVAPVGDESVPDGSPNPGLMGMPGEGNA